MQYIYVLNDDGTPLMPTRRVRHVRCLLNKGKARIVSHVPFVVQLKYHSEGITQPLTGGMDPGRTNIGIAVRTDNGKIVYRAHVETRNRTVPRLMAERRRHRQASRRGERLARKRMAKRYGTVMRSGSVKRHLPGYQEGTVLVKDIINTEARFNNRKRPASWLTPSALQLVETHISAVCRIMDILPVTGWALEINRFAFMAMDDGTVKGTDFRNGRMKGYPSVKAYVYARQDGKCLFCGSPIEHYHHLEPRSKGGSNLPENLIGVCRECHRKIHTGILKPDVQGIKKKYGALSVLNQAIPSIAEGLETVFGAEYFSTCFGYQTKKFRETADLPKDHDIDAVCISCVETGLVPDKDMPELFEIQQYRRHDRQLVRKQSERTYYLDGRAVCKNRHKRFEQKDDSLDEFRKAHPEDIGRLTVKKSTRSYNDPGRLMPGAVFMYHGERHVLSGTKNKGTRFMYQKCSPSGISTKQCRDVRQNTGLVYVA